MSDHEVIQHDILGALSRPLMVLGVTLEYLLLTGMAMLILFILSSSVRWLILYLPLHVLGWLACQYDPCVFMILIKQCDFCYSPNQFLWGCHSYDAW